MTTTQYYKNFINNTTTSDLLGRLLCSELIDFLNKKAL